MEQNCFGRFPLARGRRRLLLSYLLILCSLYAIKSEPNDKSSVDNFQEFSAGVGEKALFPNIFNLATHAEIRATSTCGQYGAEYYCKLVEHVFLRQPQCDICDANNHNKNHPIDYAIDGTRRWWQSPSLGNGLAYELVNITIDLRQEYQVAYVILKSGISPRPGTWAMEKSLDGVKFEPWQYFAISDSECMRVFGVPATVGVPKFAKDNEVICTSYFSKLNPLEYGEVHTSLVNGRPGADHTSPELQAFTRTRFVRLRLLGLRTLHADLMVINRRDGKLDQSVTRRYFYSISDISIGGQCICYGHAERCPPEETHGQFRCECRHNTYGESCNQCLPLFNQLPWRPGTHDHPNICQECQCFRHADKCVYDAEIESQRLSVTPEGVYEGGGRCVDCQHNTDGINCEKCKLEFYRPANYSHYQVDACRPCDCDLVGAENNLCIRDETEAHNELRPGDCICKPGFGGRRCDRCAVGFRNHPICEPCPCNQAGSLNFETCEEEKCSCKGNVEGEFCDRCKPGTLYLDKANPLGCQPCFCFGKSGECAEERWSVVNVYAHHTGWNLTDLYDRVEAPVKTESLSSELVIFNSEDYREYSGENELVYWKVPMGGNWLNSYGSNLYYYVYFVPNEKLAPNAGYPTQSADFVIEGNDARLEYYSRLNFFPRENISVTIPLRVTNNWIDARSRRPIDKADLMRVLANVDNVFVRAKYHQIQLQSSIYGLRRESGAPSSLDSDDSSADLKANSSLISKKIIPVEICKCPEHFEGNSCERCETGYRRVGNQLYDGMCKKCECEGHSDKCDPHTGHCIDCQHSTTGPRCELCERGHYGNPSLGGELGTCKLCACPTVENSHSTHCSLSQLVFEGAAAAEQDAYVCTACETGYDGNKCEICADGFYGDPFDASSETGGCRPCNCSGNVDSAAIGNCDRSTGVCLRCVGHTAGDHCEYCAENHWGSALLHSCHPCDCHHAGAQSLQCANLTGQCECREGYRGTHCDRCEAGHGDVENGCPPCECDTLGAASTTCDEVSGQCMCKNGVYGKHCDKCIPSYFNFTAVGCQFCHCDAFGAVPGKECHNVTGECQCQPNVVGISCEKCASGFFNISSGEGCQECKCDAVGSEGDECDVTTGQCRCKPGVTGLKCDKCEPNFWGLDNKGCKRCQVCPAPGQVCDQITGECVCPPNTEGAVCERCASNAWNYHPFRGCELCDCDGVGADSTECNARTGQCKCKSGYVGHKCDHCEAGFFNFPDCEPCNCNLAGTEIQQCRGPTCLCSNEGQCKCKKYVTGLKCDQCAVNSFSLEAQNPWGCTECFCFGRTADCAQGEFVWRQIYSPDRKVVFEAPFEYYTRRHNIHILREAPPLNYNSYPTNHTPLYWPLPRTFLGDRTLSYNGWIRFRIRNDANYRGQQDVRPDSNTYRLFPQVLLIGNNRIELEYTPTGEIPFDGKYKIHLHETEWRNRISPQLPLSRKQLMVALQNVQAIYIRGSYNDVYRGDSISISELSVDVASLSETPVNVSSISTDTSATNVAVGVEVCNVCPKGYTGPSCQNPAEGFCRKRDPDYLNNADDLALVGVASLCACNGHSEACDPENCRCNNCEHNTVGDFCELCRPGYYGNAVEGHSDVCRKCACPNVENSFSETCHSVPNGRGYTCDACRAGYTGQYCETCEVGYYGNPTVENGFCALCACHTFGSRHGVCHNVTGQCDCIQGVTGRDCSLCSPRHAFINGACSLCDRGCHKELMKMEDEMEYGLGSLQNLADLKPIPRKRLARISETVTSLNEIIDNIKSSEHDAENLLNEHAKGENRYTKQASVVEQEFNLLEERNADSLARLNALAGDLNAIRELLQTQNHRVVVISNQLAQLAHRSEGNQEANEAQNLLSQAEQYLNSTNERNNLIEKSLNYAKKNAEDADQVMKEILSKKLDDSEYKQLREKYDEINAIIKDFRNLLWDRSNADANRAKSMGQFVNENLTTLRAIIGEVEALNDRSQNSLVVGNNATEAIKAAVLNVHNTYKEVEDTLFVVLREQRDRLTELAEGYSIDSHLHDAQSHAVELERKAQNLKGIFNSIQSSDAFAASNVYKGIVTAMKDAENASQIAKQSAEESFALVDPSTSLVNLAEKSLDDSKTLDEELEKVLNELSISESNSRLQKGLARLQELENDAAKNILWIKDVHQLLDDHHDRINTVYTTVDEAHKGLGDIERRTRDFVKSVDDVKERTDVIQRFNQQSIQDQINNVTQSTSDISDVEKSLEEVKVRTDRHADQIHSIRQDLNVLKEKINEAREKASKIRIAIKSDVGDNCVREYVSPMNPAASNVITIKYRPAIDSPDSLIFLTTTKGTRSQSREYIAVELRGKKIHVKWDIGDGKREAAIIKRNIIYIPASDRYTWYQIEVKRVANTVQVGVVQKQALTGEGERNVDEPTHVSVGEPDVSNDVVFNTVPGQSRIYVGHVDPHLVEELDLVTNRFHGTVGELNVDGVNVPLWVFDKSTGNCDGSAGPQVQPASGHMFRNGFAQVRMPMNDRSSSMISIQFSAYSPNGLLYFRGSQNTGEYVAISLHDGAVELKADYGPPGESQSDTAKDTVGESGAVRISVRSAQSNYADGRVHKIRAIRNKGEVHLQIDQDDHVSTALTSDNSILEIREPDHYVGGIPPNFNHSAFDGNDIQFGGFFGCIQSVRPNQVSELDLDFPYRSQHKEQGCAYREERLTTLDRVIGFSKPTGGFVLVKGVQLTASPPSTFAFNFRSRRANAVLLYQSANLKRSTAKRRKRDENNDQTFFGFYLFNGRLIAQFGIGAQQKPTLSSNQSYNDGLLHSVFLSRSGSTVQVRVDDRELLSATLEDETPIGASDSHPLLVLGGLPTNLLASDTTERQNLGTSEPLVGCLSDLQYNYERLPLALEEHFGVSLGSCEFERGSTQEKIIGGEAITSENNQQNGELADQTSQNFNRKKSPQSLEPVSPTLSSSSTEHSHQLDDVTHYHVNDADENMDEKYSLSSIGRSRRRESTCGGATDLASVWQNASEFSTAQSDVNGVRFGISESSHARVNFPVKPYPDYTNFKLSFSFRTRQKNALLWSWASYKNYARYFFLNIEHGFLTLVIKGHREPKYLHYKARKFNDDEWHTVELAKLDHEVNLQVDDYTAEFLRDAPNPKVMRKRMYVGGVISKHRKFFNKKPDSESDGAEKMKMLPGFVGCIRNFRVNGVAESLLKTSRDLVPCAHSRDVSYIHHGGFATFEPLKSHGKMKTIDGTESADAELSIQFRLAASTPISDKPSKNRGEDPEASPVDQMIFGLFSTGEDSYQTGRLMLRIENSSLVLSAHFARHRIIMEERFTTNNMAPFLGPICAGEWHRLVVRIGTRSSTVKLDGERVELKKMHFSHVLLDEIRSLPVHIGGATAPISMALNVRSLTGCIKNLEFSGIPIQMDTATKLHKVVKDGCPY